jgi:mono/diheme cytochrome c family protein
MTCHTPRAGGVLGLKTRQLNRDLKFPNGVTDNELRAWNHIGLFEPELKEADVPGYAKLARADDASRSIEDRARSYLDANCAQCHRPGGTVAYFDARYDTPLGHQNLIEGQVLINQGIDNAQIVSPNDIWRSILYMRMSTVDSIKMPPLAHEVRDEQSAELLRNWITSMPGPPVLAPPTISPHGGEYARTVEVTLTTTEPGASVHYTLDGSTPTKSDALYDKPIKISGPTTLRVKAYKSGFTKSITAQETFIVGE